MLENYYPHIHRWFYFAESEVYVHLLDKPCTCWTDDYVCGCLQCRIAFKVWSEKSRLEAKKRREDLIMAVKEKAGL